MKKPTVGFIGQGYIGKNYADDFEKRGYHVVRYSNEEPFVKNKDKIKDCQVVFIAVPTPTTPKGFQDSIVREVIGLVGKGKIAVIKSTILPELTEVIQKENPNIYVFHSPEFLTARNASYDAAHPNRNIIGIPKDTPVYRKKANEVLKLLPKAPFELVCSSREASIIKYAGNNWLYLKVIFVNMLYDLVRAYGLKWENVRDALAHDHRIGGSHLDPVFEGGRGAGGPCFIKDFAVFKKMYGTKINDKGGKMLLKGVEDKNLELLLSTKKDLELLIGVYGKSILKRRNKK